MPLTIAYANTTVSFDKSMGEIEKMLAAHGIRESRFTHRAPEQRQKDEKDLAPETLGHIIYEFVYGKDETRRGVRVTVAYRPGPGNPGTKTGGTTREMGARAMFWFLKAKFDSIDYGIEAFDVAFMPHLITAIGETFAERPALIVEAAMRPEAIGMLSLPAPREAVR